MIELSKRQKGIARELIQLALQRECKSFVEELSKWMNSSKSEYETPHKLYLQLYRKIESFDGHIAKRYNDLTGSHYYVAVLSLLHDGILKPEDIASFGQDVQNQLLGHVEFFRNQ